MASVMYWTHGLLCNESFFQFSHLSLYQTYRPLAFVVDKYNQYH